MLQKSVQVNQNKINFYFNASFKQLKQLVNVQSTFIITDANVYALHKSAFKNRKTIVIAAGESSKNLATVQLIIEQLIELKADRTATIIGVEAKLTFKILIEYEFE
jgi:3-dehydroquinate synthase